MKPNITALVISPHDIDHLIPPLADAGINVARVYETDSALVRSYSRAELFDINLLTAASRPLPYSFCRADPFESYAAALGRLSPIPFVPDLYTFDSGSIPLDQIRDWFALHRDFFTKELESTQPQIIIFFRPPHTGPDIVLSHVAAVSRVPVICFLQSLVPGKFFYYQKPGQIDRGSYPLWFGGGAAAFENGFALNLFYMEKKSSMLTLARCLAPNRVAAIVRNPGQALAALYRKETRAYGLRLRSIVLTFAELLSAQTRYKPFVRSFLRREARSQKSKRRFKSFPVDVPFVFFPLHLQPEATTSALGERFHNQVDALERLHALLPRGWIILLKENPKQGYMYRGGAFYERIRRLQNVFWIPGVVPSGSVIKAAQLVATITGTAGYEALLEKKPVVYFGHAWYGDLLGAFRFSDDLDLKRLASEVIDMDLFREKLEMMFDHAANGVVYPPYEALLNGLSRETRMVSDTANSIRRICDHYIANSVV